MIMILTTIVLRTIVVMVVMVASPRCKVGQVCEQSLEVASKGPPWRARGARKTQHFALASALYIIAITAIIVAIIATIAITATIAIIAISYLQQPIAGALPMEGGSASELSRHRRSSRGGERHRLILWLE